MRRPFPWEKSYPPGVSWDAPLATSTIPELLAGAVARFGNKTAIEYRGRRLSYEELGRLVDRAAAAFLKLGAETVALYLPNTAWHPVAFFGALKAGARVVHLSPLDAERELRHKLADSGARVVVTINHPMLLPKAQKLDAKLIVADDAYWAPAPEALLPIPEDALSFTALLDAEPPARSPSIAEDDVAVLQYTGGTTGVPKGAMLTHRNLTAACSSYDAWLSGQGLLVEGEDRVIAVLPLFHIYALTTILLRHLKHGSELLLRPRFDVETTLRDIEEKRATVLLGVPTMWIAIAASPGVEKRDFSSLRYCGSGGAPLPIEVDERVRRLTGKRLRGGWGMTETSPAGTNLPQEGPDKPGSCGLPLPGIELGIVALDDPRRVLGPGEKGELRIKGPNVMKGYWKRPEETAAAFVDGYFLTGDIATMDEDGYFYIVDRKKDMIISGGFNVYPRVIEEALYEHPAVEEAIVIGVPDAYRGEAAKAFVKLRAGAAPFTLEEARAFLADKVGKHEMPAALEFRSALPKTAVGKLSKKELIEEERRKFKEA
ncbi:MAG: dicarboxylate--CoA ligase PimA [Rhodospirillales bacterium]|nr:dicarboxylate--CoA ligase PimA [Rhodospirillales bacterium]